MPSNDLPMGAGGNGGDGVYSVLAILSCIFLGAALALVQIELWQFYRIIVCVAVEK